MGDAIISAARDIYILRFSFYKDGNIFPFLYSPGHGQIVADRVSSPLSKSSVFHADSFHCISLCAVHLLLVFVWCHTHTGCLLLCHRTSCPFLFSHPLLFAIFTRYGPSRRQSFPLNQFVSFLPIQRPPLVICPGYKFRWNIISPCAAARTPCPASFLFTFFPYFVRCWFVSFIGKSARGQTENPKKLGWWNHSR
jgi:hypothetical protein